MAWIESHQELGRHPKTKKLARILGVSIPAAVGHLQFLWWWALDYAQDGALARFTPEDIADAILWEGGTETLILALHEAGFLDISPEGSYTIHDWNEYAGRLLDKRRQNTERKRQSRGSHAAVTQDTRGSHGATQPYTTVPNRTVPKDKDIPALGTAGSCDLAPARHYNDLLGASEGTKKELGSTFEDTSGKGNKDLCVGVPTDVQTPGTTNQPEAPKEPQETEPLQQHVRPPFKSRWQQELFDGFWLEYPKRRAKGTAEKAWVKINPSEELSEAIVNGLKHAKTSAEWAKEGGKYIPHPASWLNAKGWEDEYQEVRNRGAPTVNPGTAARQSKYPTRRIIDGRESFG